MLGHRRRVAAVVNEYWERSHADLIVTRLMAGYELLWVPLEPRVDVVSLYIDHAAELDVGRRRAAEHGATVFPSIREALTRGGSELAVDGVVLIGERNQRGGRPLVLDERGQAQDPRARYFAEIAAACQELGRPVPVFIDKHLAAGWDDAKRVYDLARGIGMPLMAGSSVPVTVRCPPAQVPLGAVVEEVVVVATGIGEAPIFHPLELAQSMIERRRGYETGVASVRFLSGDPFWAAWEAGDEWSRDLERAALAAVPHAPGSPRDYYRRHVGRGDGGGAGTGLPALTGREEAVLVEYRDGLRLTILLLTGYMLRRSVAVRIQGHARPLVTSTPTGAKVPDEPMEGPMVPEPGEPKPPTWNFDHLAFFIDEFLSSGRPPVPVERTLLTAGVVDAAFASRHRSGERVPTPHLAVSYEPVGRKGESMRS